MWELWTLMWILCYSQIIRIKKYSVTKYCRCAQRNPNKKCPPQKGFAPTSEKWIGSIILPCSQVKCNYTTVQESVLYKRHRSIVNKNLWWKKLQMAIFVSKCMFTGTQTHKTPPKYTARHRKTNPAIFQPIPDRLQSRGRSTPKRGFVVSTPVQNHHLPLEGHLSSTSSSLSMPSCSISL